MDSQTEKRMRGANFSADEKALLLVTVQKYNNIINCKKSDATTWKENEAAWEKIGKEFNAQSPARIYRELPSLKTIYKNTKRLTKRVAANEKRESRATGGARAPEGDKPDFYELALGTIDRDTVFVLPENGGDISSEEENGHETSTTITQSTENLQEVATTSIQERACPLEARRAAERVKSPPKSQHLQDAVERDPISASSRCCVNPIHQVHDVGKKKPLSLSNSRVSSPTPSATSSTPPSPANQPAREFKYTVREIPANLATQLRVNNNKTALVKAPLAPNFVKTLQVAANSPTITIVPINRKTPGPGSAPKKPTFSVVVRDVPQDISAEEIATLCPSLSIVKAWGIVSRKSNRPTSFIRVLTTDKLTVDYGRTFDSATVRPNAPIKPSAPNAPKSHPPNKCPAKEPSCSSCNGPHPAWSRACPSFKHILVTDETPVLPLKIIDPPTAIAEPTDSDSDLENDTTITIIKSLITFMTKTLFDLFPMQRSKIQTILENTSKSVFNVVTKVSHSGHKIHLTFDQ
ncbi:hypothetical protein MTP99_013061 [Tenebrio molitor]|nr:hypothetical protein MTP99_013061 [Tenebrio molitor]